MQADNHPVERQPDQIGNVLSPHERGVMRSLVYFGLFNHPLTAEELRRYHPIQDITTVQVDAAIEKLLLLHIIFETQGYYQLAPNAGHVERRIAGAALAKTYLQRAIRISRWIGCMPFVRGVLISGSLSKGYMDKGSDIDYFIVTQKGRLWLCRSLLAIIRKMMPKPLRKYFCINYFIDNHSLSIPDHNLFVATELAFVTPTYNKQVWEQLLESNEWFRAYYPNKLDAHEAIQDVDEWPWFKRISESLLSGNFGEKLDTWFFNIMLKRWKKRYKDFDVDSFDLNIRTRKNVSKQHEKGHQFVVLQLYKDKMKELENLHGVKLNDD